MTPKTATLAATILFLLVHYAPAHGARVIKYNIRDKGPFVLAAYSDQTMIVSFPAVVELAVTDRQSPLVTPLFERYSRGRSWKMGI